MPKYSELLYFFKFGRHPLLALAELINLLKVANYKYKLIHRTEDGAILEIARPVESIADLQDQLGGTIKIVWLRKYWKGKIFELKEHVATAELQKSYLAQTDSKVTFGISVYAEPELDSYEDGWLRSWIRTVKEDLDKQGISARYVEDDVFNLSSVVIDRNQLLKKGAEFVLLRFRHPETRTQMENYFGQTLTHQDYEGYGQRDFGKPAPDPLSGMLPPKLAQMMVNSTRRTETSTIWDPFVGSGVVLQEAMLLGLKVYGSDLEPVAVENSEKNVEWFHKLKFKKDKSFKNNFKVADATTVKWAPLNDASVVIVAEPYLGPPQRKALKLQDAKALAKELGDLYLGFFDNLKSSFPKIKRIGMVMPVFKTTEGLVYVDIVGKLAFMGYLRSEILPAKMLQSESSVSKRGGFIYSRPDQVVLREFFVFEKKR